MVSDYVFSYDSYNSLLSSTPTYWILLQLKPSTHHDIQKKSCCEMGRGNVSVPISMQTTKIFSPLSMSHTSNVVYKKYMKNVLTYI